MRTAHAKAQIRKRRETDFWRAVNRFLFLLCGLGLVVLIALAFLPELRRIQEMKASLAGLEKELAGQKLQLSQLQRKENLFKTNPAYNELVARDLLGVMKDGDTVFRLDEQVPVTPASAPAAEPGSK